MQMVCNQIGTHLAPKQTSINGDTPVPSGTPPGPRPAAAPGVDLRLASLPPPTLPVMRDMECERSGIGIGSTAKLHFLNLGNGGRKNLRSRLTTK